MSNTKQELVVQTFNPDYPHEVMAASAYIKSEISRYISPKNIQQRAEDRLMECIAKGLNPFEWAYVETYEEINFKRAVYFRWEKIT